jgi:DNA modification methylase
MGRVERIGLATLYLGDCREIAPTLERPAAVIADPPYGLGDKWQGGGGSKRSSWRFDPKEARAWDKQPCAGVPALLALADAVIVWGGNYYALPPSRCWLVWDKKQNDKWTTGQAELAWTNIDKPVRVFRFATCEQASEGAKEHPTQKPLALMTWCLKWVPDGVVMDPYMGSGTTGVACVQQGRPFIGIEIEPRYFDIACRRIEQAQRQPDLLIPATQGGAQ